MIYKIISGNTILTSDSPEVNVTSMLSQFSLSYGFITERNKTPLQNFNDTLLFNPDYTYLYIADDKNIIGVAALNKENNPFTLELFVSKSKKHKLIVEHPFPSTKPPITHNVSSDAILWATILEIFPNSKIDPSDYEDEINYLSTEVKLT
jgi:hypothetical protein